PEPLPGSRRRAEYRNLGLRGAGPPPRRGPGEPLSHDPARGHSSDSPPPPAPAPPDREPPDGGDGLHGWPSCGERSAPPPAHAGRVSGARADGRPADGARLPAGLRDHGVPDRPGPGPTLPRLWPVRVHHL